MAIPVESGDQLAKVSRGVIGVGEVFKRGVDGLLSAPEACGKFSAKRKASLIAGHQRPQKHADQKDDGDQGDNTGAQGHGVTLSQRIALERPGRRLGMSSREYREVLA